MNTQGWIGPREALVDVMSTKLGFKVHISDNNSRRARLWLVDPHCAYCGVETIWWEAAGGSKPRNAATLQHLDSRLSGRRKVWPRDPSNARSTIACNHCNFEDGRAEVMALPEEVRARLSHTHDIPKHSRRWFVRQLQAQI